MKKIRTVEAAVHVGETVCINGWLQQHRRHGSLSFLILRDGWGTIQAVCEDKNILAPIAKAGLESVISIKAKVVAMPQAPGGVELHPHHIQLDHPC